MGEGYSNIIGYGVCGLIGGVKGGLVGFGGSGFSCG